MMLTIICNDCHSEHCIRGWIEKKDLKGTAYENMIATITDKELYELESKGKIKDEVDKFYDNPVCPECGSTNIVEL